MLVGLLLLTRESLFLLLQSLMGTVYLLNADFSCLKFQKGELFLVAAGSCLVSGLFLQSLLVVVFAGRFVPCLGCRFHSQTAEPSPHHA
jgi:hypothetical protein